MNSIVGIYKPKGITSHDVIVKVRKFTGEKRVGHAGTLDPLASGVLVIGIGREATKRLSIEVQKEKEYLAKIKLGEESTTDDEEGIKTISNFQFSMTNQLQNENTNYKIPSLDEVQKTLSKFVGKIEQVPPQFSALKVKGQTAYKLARKGKKIELQPRIVEIKEIELVFYEYPFIHLRVVSGPGVYIRALARDLGRVLKTGGYLAGLERTRVGEFTKEKAYTIEKFEYLKKRLMIKD